MTNEPETRHDHCCVCPYCDTNLKQALPICVMCGRQMRYCSECGSPVKKEDDVCPNCGAHRPAAQKRPGA